MKERLMLTRSTGFHSYLYASRPRRKWNTRAPSAIVAWMACRNVLAGGAPDREPASPRSAIARELQVAPLARRHVGAQAIGAIGERKDRADALLAPLLAAPLWACDMAGNRVRRQLLVLPSL